MFKRNNPLYTGFLAIAIVFLSSCGNQQYADETEEAMNEESLVHPFLLKWTDTLSCQGRIEVPPQNRISIHSSVTAFVKAVYHYNGSAVKRGEVLARLEHPSFIDPQRNYLEALAKRNFLKSELSRMKALHQASAVSDKSMQQASADFEMNEAQIKTWAAELDMMGFHSEQIANTGMPERVLELRAPVSGFISSLMINKGKLVNPDDLMIELIDREHLHLELEVYGNDINKLEKGMQVYFQAGKEGKTYQAEIYLINPVVRENTNTVQVHAHLMEEDERSPDMRPGMFVQARIVTKQNSAWAVPVTVLGESDEGAGLWAERLVNGSWQLVGMLPAGYRNQYAILPHGHELADSTIQLKTQSFGGEE